MEAWSYVGILAVIYVSFLFIKRIGKGIPILELLLLIAGLQWIVGAFLEYKFDFGHFKYYMYVNELTYMSYVVPAYLVFVFFTLYKSKKVNLQALPLDFEKYSQIGTYIFFIGVAARLLKSVSPDSLRFIFFLLQNFIYVGAIILLFSAVKWHKILSYGGVVYLVLSSVISGFFHDLILWGSFIYLFWAFKNKPSLKLNLAILVVGLFVSTILQGVKTNYRQMIWGGYQGDYVSLFFNLFGSSISTYNLETSSDGGELNARLNQGWIISAVMDHTPRVQRLAYGSTIKEAVFATMLPRFINPNKARAGGIENFEKYTGLYLEEGTSMGISLMGEGYANYGKTGGIIFMGFWGLTLTLFWVFISKQIKRNNLILFFVPLIFLQVVKAETELVVVLNHLVKATVLVFGVLYIMKKTFRINFENE